MISQKAKALREVPKTLELKGKSKSEMYRNKEIKIRLTEHKLKQLDRNVAKTTFSREGYIRMVLNGYTLVEKPPMRYWELLRELREIAKTIQKRLYDKLLSSDFEQYKDLSPFPDQIERVCDELQDWPMPKKQEIKDWV